MDWLGMNLKRCCRVSGNDCLGHGVNLCDDSIPKYVLTWQCSVVWHCQCPYKYGRALLRDTVSACTNVAVLSCVILSVPVSMWQCSVLWYRHSVYQCGSALLCDNVSVCINVAVLCCVILSVPVTMWHCSVVWYCECLYKYGSAIFDW